MSYQVEYTLNGQTEIEEAWLWIKDRAELAAEKWREELIGKIDALSVNPHRHPLAPESANFPEKSG